MCCLDESTFEQGLGLGDPLTHDPWRRLVGQTRKENVWAFDVAFCFGC